MGVSSHFSHTIRAFLRTSSELYFEGESRVEIWSRAQVTRLIG
jgi:hypothetical protein